MSVHRIRLGTPYRTIAKTFVLTSDMPVFFGRCELDIHANTFVAGQNCLPMHFMERVCDVMTMKKILLHVYVRTERIFLSICGRQLSKIWSNVNTSYSHLPMSGTQDKWHFHPRQMLTLMRSNPDMSVPVTVRRGLQPWHPQSLGTIIDSRYGYLTFKFSMPGL